VFTPRKVQLSAKFTRNRSTVKDIVSNDSFNNSILSIKEDAPTLTPSEIKIIFDARLKDLQLSQTCE
jgi:hypothetical protein